MVLRLMSVWVTMVAISTHLVADEPDPCRPPWLPECAQPMFAAPIGLHDYGSSGNAEDLPTVPDCVRVIGGPYGQWVMGLGQTPWHRPLICPEDARDGTPSATPCANQPSSCWRVDRHTDVVWKHTTPGWGDSRGFPLNLDTHNLPATTNYPPISQQAWASTAPLVSTPGDQTYRPLFLTDRKLVAGVIDPMTGQPLIREQDLELPVGNASFRLIRSYGGNADGSAGPPGKVLNGQGDRLAIGKMWDWAGTGWMMSENPILLFDSQYIHHEPSLPRRCYLILDAHHSIPFTQDIQTGNYIAPAWFDAIMTWREPVDGVQTGAWNFDDATTTGSWAQRPQYVKIRLYGESVTYTFKIKWDEDVSPLFAESGQRLAQNAHASPALDGNGNSLTVQPPDVGNGGGLGVPYTAFLHSIEDRFGNRMVIEHAPNRKYALDASSGCETCVQTCAEKGQIRTVRLYRAGEPNTPEWTLLYVHRSFRVWAPDLSQVPCAAPLSPPPEAMPVVVAPALMSSRDSESRWLLQNAVHAIYVFKGSVALPSIPDDGWTLPAEAFVGEHDGNAFTSTYSGLDAHDEEGWTERKIASHLGWQVPGGWQHRLRYTYDESIRTLDRCHTPAEYRVAPDAEGRSCCVKDAQDDCISVPTVEPSRRAAFGDGGIDEIPGIFFWGTPLKVVSEDRGPGFEPLIRIKRLTPSLLRVERSDEPYSEGAPASRSYTGYMYATHLDAPLSLLSPHEPTSGGLHPALSLDRQNRLAPEADHTSDVIMPKLKHIFRHERLVQASRHAGADSINGIFDPEVVTGTQTPRNQASYAEIADVTFDWQPLGPPQGEPEGPLTWVLRGLIGQCVINQVARERMFIRSGENLAMVTRVKLNTGDAADGIYDLLYIGVRPPEMQNNTFSCAFDQMTAGLQEQDLQCANFPAPYTLFPFAWRRLAISNLTAASFFVTDNLSERGPIVAAPLGEPMFLTLVDRHDGACSGAGAVHERAPYLIRHLARTRTESSTLAFDANNPPQSGVLMRPHHRQVVGLNPAGFVLFERTWDYQGGGVTAVGPAEEFVYEETQKTMLMPDGTPKQVTTGLRLTEHRSLNWGVAYTMDLQENPSSGSDAGCYPSGTAISDSRGLVTSYEYHDYFEGQPPELVQTQLIKRVSIREGKATEPAGRQRPISENTYDDNLQVASQKQFVLSNEGVARPSITTDRHIEYYPSAADEPKRIKSETVWQAGSRPWPDAPFELMPFEYRFFDEKGMQIGRAYGLCSSIAPDGRPGRESPTTDDGTTIFVDVYGNDPWGRRVIEIIDAAIIAVPDQSPDVSGGRSGVRRTEWNLLRYDEANPPAPRLPTDDDIDGFLTAAAAFAQRVIPASQAHLNAPLNRTTAYGYAPDGALEIVAKPGGRYDFTVMRGVTVNLQTAPPDEDYWTARIFTSYPDVVYTGASGSESWVATKAGQLTTMLHWRPRRGWSVEWSQPLTMKDGVPSFAPGGATVEPDMFEPTPAASFTQPVICGASDFTAIAALEPEYDQAGRPIKMKAVGLESEDIPQTEIITRESYYTDFGLVDKRLEASRTIHRRVTTPLGQVIAEFKGTKDNSGCWQGASDGADNMALMARHVYGIGINNIRQLVLTRRYRNMVGCAQTDYHARGASAFLSDLSGWEEAYGYDRRGRRCAVEIYGQPTPEQAHGNVRPQPTSEASDSIFGEADVPDGESARKLLRGEYTWYDHLDRVRFVATFSPIQAEAMRQSAVDPRARDVYTLGDPAASQILQYHPERLIENVYNGRGQLEEVIEYDVRNSSGAGSTAHLSTRMYYDHHGRVTHRISSTGRWERSTYDALGRLISTSTLRGEMNGVPGENAYEIERTDNAYHENGQVERSSRLVRINIEPDPEGVAPLIAGSGGNAVRTDTLTWYDESGRVIFTASLGTDWFEATASNERPNGIFANASATPPLGPTAEDSPFAPPPEWNANAQEWQATWMSGPAARVAHITQTVYDDTGRVAETRGPDGVRTVNRYDGLNRKVMEIVYPADADGNLSAAQGTAYQYREGKLVRIGALRPGHLTNEAPLPRFGNPSDQSIQITELVYGDSQAGANGTSARIVDASSGVPIVYDPNGTGSGTIAQDYDLLRGVKFAKGGCACDFNNVGGITVQDLFDFLAAHGSGNLSADFNGNGVVTVQDIFDFLACYFAGAEDCGRILAASANDGLDIQFEYTLDGMIYSRSDLTRIAGSADPVVRKLAFSYDHLGRRIGVEVKSGAPNIADAVERTRYFYDSLDRLIKATAEARDHAGHCYYPVATSTFAHDSFGNLLSEKLLHGGAADNLVAALQYQWAYTITAQGPPLTAGDGPVLVPRLAGMTLPWSAGNDGLAAAHRGRVAYGYGQPFTTPSDSSWLDGSLNRVRTINWHTGQGAGAPTLPIARYHYAGASMRAGVTLGPGTIPGTQDDAIVQDFAHGNAEIAGLGGRPALAGLDRFGRTRDLSYLTGVTLNNADARARQQLRYDDRRGGLLIGERLTQRQSTGGGGGGGGTTGVDRSWTYGYDGFGRLQTAARGTLSGEWTFDATDRRNLQQDWTLDDLGNWNGGPPAQAAPGLHERRFDAQGVLASLEARRHATDARNQIIHQSYTPFDPSTTPPTALDRVDVKYAYDPSGRMIYDGRVIYDHDAFGRVVQIREVLKELTFDSSGAIAVPDTADTGRLIAHYSYDALGRVIRTQRPVGSASGSTGERLAITDLYYDGVRVVQEVGWASVPGLPVPVTPGGTAYLPRPARHIAGDGEIATLPSGLAGEVCSPPTPAIGWNWPDRRLEREYLWHADPGAYVDECAAQLVYTEAHAWNGIDESGDDTTATVLYTLSDHNATVMAVTDELGRVVAQYGYTPYGDLLAAELFANGSDSLAIESLAAARGNRLGHQGLRTERFDRPWDGPLDIASAVSTGTGATGRYRSVCHNRNRLYDPAEGRFTGVDPNGLGVPVLNGLAFGGMAIGAGDVAPDLMGHYGDGMNAHVAYGSMPRGARDPSGLVISNIIEGMYEGLLSQYIDNLSWDVDWATNWNLPDDANTRQSEEWVDDAIFWGAVGGLIEFAGLEDELGEYIPYIQAGPESDQYSVARSSPSKPTSGLGRGVKARLRQAKAITARGAATTLNIEGHEVKLFRGKVDGKMRTLVEFSPSARLRDPVTITPTGNRNRDKAAADAKAGFSEANPRPKNADWHHGNNYGEMILIPSSIHRHRLVRHAGGFLIWSKK